MIPEDFHKMAEDMYNDPHVLSKCTANSTDDECFYRTIIERAYYAAFLKSKEGVIQNNGYVPYDDGKDHYYVSESLKSARALGNKRHSMAGKLYNLRKARGNASYVLLIRCSRNQASDILTKSDLLIQDFP